MTITKQNEGKILTENIFIEDVNNDGDTFGAYSWYGGGHVELTNGRNTISFDRKEFLEFAEMVAVLKEEFEKYDK